MRSVIVFFRSLILIAIGIRELAAMSWFSPFSKSTTSCVQEAPGEPKLDCSFQEECLYENESNFGADRTRRVDIRTTQGTGIGFDRGYSSLDLFLLKPFHGSWIFFDGRGHVFNDAKVAANVGFGVRQFLSSGSILGGNIYYDCRQSTRHGFFQQIGLGIEVFRANWTVRANGYLPVGKKQKSFGDISFDKFRKHRALFQQPNEVDFYGADAEVGATIYKKGRVTVEGTAGGYYLSGKLHNQGGGGLARLSAKISPYITLEAQTSYDNLFKWSGWGSIALNYSFGCRAKVKNECSPCERMDRLSARLAETVSRFEILPIKKTKQDEPALDASGNPLYFIFVDNVRGSSDGSYEHPFATLLEAQNNSSPGDVLYVFSGDGTTRGMDQGITLQNSQQLLGSGLPYLGNSAFGYQTIPAQTPNYPIITNTNPAAVIRLASSNIISGMHILSTNFTDGIDGLNIANATISSNIFDSSAAGIFVDTLQGQWNCSNNIFENLNQHGMIFVARNADVVNLDIFSNNFSTGPGFFGNTGIGVISMNNSKVTATIESNVISGLNGGNAGIALDPFNTSSIFFKINNNLLQNVSGQGIQVIVQNAPSATAFGHIENNTVITSGVAAAYQLQTVSAGDSLCVGLVGNQALGTTPKYVIGSGSVLPAALSVEASPPNLGGLQAENTGTFMIVGPVQYVAPGTCSGL